MQDPQKDCRPVDCVEKYNGWRNFFRDSTGKCEVVHECYTKGKKGELPEIVRMVTLYLSRNPIENRAISGFSGQKSVPE